MVVMVSIMSSIWLILIWVVCCGGVGVIVDVVDGMFD